MMTPEQIQVIEALNLPYYEHEFGWRFAVVFLTDDKSDKECFRVNDFGHIYHCSATRHGATPVSIKEALKIAKLAIFR